MSSPQVPRPTATASAEPDWTEQVTDLVVDVVDSVRDRTTGTVLQVARYVVFGLVALIVLPVILVLVLLGLGRAIAQIPIPLWVSYLGLGILFTLGGFFCWSKRFPSE
jgi:hypothetical protein